MQSLQNEVAHAIVRQLGPLALTMLAARNLIAFERGLQFSTHGSKRSRVIVIELDASNTYTVSFWNAGRRRLRLVAEASGVLAEDLLRVVESNTRSDGQRFHVSSGLSLSL